MKRKQTPEGALQRLVMDWLAARHIFALRMNSGVLKGASGRPVTFGVPGCADILAFKPKDITTEEAYGFLTRFRTFHLFMPVWIELKAPKGKQSELQKSFQAKVESEGHRYLVIRDLSELEAQL